MAPKERRVAVYARVSKSDRDDPNSVPVQLADCRDRAEAEGWEIVAEYVDEGKSGWNPRVKRHGWEAALAALEAGEVDAILARDFERLLRQDKEGARVLELHEHRSIYFWPFADEADLDLRRARDRKDLKERVASAVYYSDRLSEKISSTHRRKAERGEWKGGGTRPFGYRIVGPKPYRVEIDEREAALIQTAAEQVLRGRGTRGIARDWNEAGVLTPTGKPWQGSRVRDVLRSEHLAGLRGDGSAGMPAILDAETSADLRTLLNDAARKKFAAPRTRRHFLVGIIRCASCDTKMTAHPNWHGTRTYICRKGYDGTGCGRMRIVADPVEELVGSRVYARWEYEPDVAASAPDPDDAAVHAALREVESSLEELARDFYAEHALSRPEYTAAKRALDAKAEELRGRIRTVAKAAKPSRWSDLAEELSKDVTWAEIVKDPGFVEWHAELAHRYLDCVLIHPARKRGPIFEPDRVEIVWRNGLG